MTIMGEQNQAFHRQVSGADILTEAHALITGPRQAEYDHPYDDYHKVKELFRTMTGHTLTVKEAVVFMVCVKLARLSTVLNRCEWKHDTIVDAAGYLGCLAMVHEHIEDMKADAVSRFDDDD